MEQVSRILNEQSSAESSGASGATTTSIPLADDKRYDRLSAVVAGGKLNKIFR